MPNIGHTIIDATGPADSLAALRDHVRSTAQGRFAFTLSPLTHPDPAPDPYLAWADLGATDGCVTLSAGMRHDVDCLFLAERLAQRFPVLRISGYFKAECDEGAFQAVCFEAGVLAYHATFENDVSCAVPFGHSDKCYQMVWFFERTPDRSLAAPDHFILIDLAGLAQRPTITASGWRQITADCTGPRVFWRKDVATGFGQALVLNGDKCTVLHNVDDWGGYGRKQQGDDAVALLPELAGEIERHRLECAASREACRRFLEAARFDDPCWDEIPF